MKIANFLYPHAVRVLTGFSSKKRLFQELGDMAASVYGVAAATTVDALQEREILGPTGVGNGVALPHARINGLDRMAGIFIRLERPLEFESVDRRPVDLIFAILGPREAGVEHLKALAAVSRTMRDEGVRAKLRRNNDPATLHAVLTETRADQPV